ncbi:MAG TPA: hypothetical protein VGN52_13165 [Burkholderiales bacterium]|jgi:hypothetical protein
MNHKGGPVVHLRQPDRHRALRALEKVHERLDVLNEKHYARLEKAGQVKCLAEIEVMDGGETAVPAPAPSSRFPENSMVFSGCNTGVVAPAIDFRAKTMVFSGFKMPQPQASPWLLQVAWPPAPAWARLRSA